MNETEAREIYRSYIKPLFENRDYSRVSDVLVENPKIKDCLSKEELRAMMDYYQEIILGVVLEMQDKVHKGLEKKINTEKMKAGRRN